MQKIITIFLVVFVIATPSNCFSQDIPEIVLLSSAYVKNEDFKNLVSLYLLPSNYSESKIIEEKKGLKDALKLLSNEFGSITNLTFNQGDVRWINLEIFGGDVDFVKRNSNFIQYVLKANFAKLGDGFIIIRVYENNGNPKLRSVGYALPDLPKNRNIIRNIGRKLMNLMFPQSKSEKT